MSQTHLAWTYLAFSILAEVLGNIALKYANGFANLIPTVSALGLYALNVWLMSMSLNFKVLSLGTTYAIWAGTGTALTAVIGMVLFGESSGSLKFLGMGFIVIGVVLLNLSPE